MMRVFPALDKRLTIYLLLLQAMHTSLADNKVLDTSLHVLCLEAEEVQSCASTPLYILSMVRQNCSAKSRMASMR